MNVAPATPAVARDWIVLEPILAWLTMWNAVEKPSIRFSNSGSTASGVTSRPVKPVPPVEMMTSIALSAIQVRICSRILLDVVGDDGAPRHDMAGLLDPLGERRAGLVVGRLAGVGHRQHRDLERHEGALVVDAGHGRCAIIAAGRGECVAGLDGAFLEAGREPALALLGAAVGEAVRHHGALRFPLQRVVADRGRRLQRRVDVARIEELVLRLGVVRPDAGEAVGLQLDLHLHAIGLRAVAGGALRLLHLGQDAEQVLHVVADLVRDHIGLGELAGLAGAAAEAPSRDR